MTDNAGYTQLDDDRTYYGNNGHVFVHRFGSGWTERENKKPLRELTPLDPIVTFNWGYIGSGANQVAIAILSDALEIPADKVPLRLYQDFTGDFVSQFPEVFRIRRYAVLRWVRGLFCDQDIHNFPAELPVASPHRQPRPNRFGKQQGDAS